MRLSVERGLWGVAADHCTMQFECVEGFGCVAKDVSATVGQIWFCSFKLRGSNIVSWSF